MIKYSKGFKAKDVWLNRAWKKLYQHAGKYQTGHSASGIKWEGCSGNQHTIASCGTSELFISICNGSPWMGAKQHRKPPGFFVVVFFFIQQYYRKWVIFKISYVCFDCKWTSKQLRELNTSVAVVGRREGPLQRCRCSATVGHTA